MSRADRDEGVPGQEREPGARAQADERIDDYLSWKADKDARAAERREALARKNAEWDALLEGAQNHTGAGRRMRLHIVRDPNKGVDG